MAGRTLCAEVGIQRAFSLGDFLELEVVLRERESAEEGVREAEDLMRRLGVEPAQLVDALAWIF